MIHEYNMNLMLVQKLGSGALVVNALLDFFTFALCPPYRLVCLLFVQLPW